MTADEIPSELPSRFPFLPPVFWTRRLVFLLVLVAAVVLVLAEQVFDVVTPEVRSEALTYLLGGFLLVVPSILAIRRALIPRKEMAIELRDDHVVLPHSGRSRFAREVPYADLRAVDLYGTPPALLVVDAADRTFVYRTGHFVDAEAPLQLREALVARIRARPDGDALLEDLARRARRADDAVHRKTRATAVIAAILGLVYLVELYTGAIDDRFTLVGLGANVPLLVARGEIYRIISANLLHANWVHLLFNVAALLTFGALVERIIGPWRFLIIYLVSGILGSLASTLFSDSFMSVGASTSIFGLLGGYAVVSLRHREKLPGGFRLHWRWWLMILVLNGSLPFVLTVAIGPIIDWVAHLGGFVFGALAAFPITRSPASVEPSVPAPSAVRAFALVLCAIWAAGGAAAIQRAGSGTDQISRLLEALADGTPADPVILNEVAYTIAISTHVTPGQLDDAHRLSLRSVEGFRGASVPIRNMVEDTLAQTYHRLGRDEEAVEVQATIVTRGAKHIPKEYSTQLARLLAAHQASGGALIVRDGLAAEDVALATGSGDEVLLTLNTHTRPLVAYFLVRDAAALYGLGQLCVGAGGPSETSLAPDSGSDPLPTGAKLELGYLASRDCASVSTNAPRWRVWKDLPEQARLP